MPSKGLSFGWKLPENNCIVQNYPKGQAVLIFPLMLFNVYTMQWGTQTMPLPGAPWETSPGTRKWLITDARRRVRSQAERTQVWEEVTRSGYVSQGRLGPPLPGQAWGHSRTSRPWLEDSVVPGLVITHYSSSPFFLHFNGNVNFLQQGNFTSVAN